MAKTIYVAKLDLRFLDFFLQLGTIFGKLYRRDRALEVAAEVVDVPDDGSNGPAVLDEAAPLEDGNVDEVPGAGDVVPIAKPSRRKGGAKRRDWDHFKVAGSFQGCWTFGHISCVYLQAHSFHRRRGDIGLHYAETPAIFCY